MAGADLANLVNEAALLAARRNHKKVEMRTSRTPRTRSCSAWSDEPRDDRRGTAQHCVPRSGHALVAWLLPGADPLDKSRSSRAAAALGITSWLPQEERTHAPRKTCSHGLHGDGWSRGEELIFDHITTGAANDLEKATVSRGAWCASSA
jgi:cell division protease FtsH